MRILLSTASLQLGLTLILSVPSLHAQLLNTTLCDTGRTLKQPAPAGCLDTSLISPINPASGGPIVDQNWQLATPYPSLPYTDPAPDPCFVLTNYTPAPVSAPDPAWYNPTDGRSQWIRPNGGTSTPAGWYIYRTEILIPPPYQTYPNYELAISGQFLVDNQVAAIYLADLDGKATTCRAIESFSNSGYSSWWPLAAEAPVKPSTLGILYFVVLNAEGPFPNPTGLRVEFNAVTLRPF